MLVCPAIVHNLLGIYTQFGHEDVWTTKVWYSNMKSFYKWKNSKIYKLYSYGPSSDITCIVVV